MQTTTYTMTAAEVTAAIEALSTSRTTYHVASVEPLRMPGEWRVDLDSPMPSPSAFDDHRKKLRGVTVQLYSHDHNARAAWYMHVREIT